MVEPLSALRPERSQSQSCRAAPLLLPGDPATSMHFPESELTIRDFQRIKYTTYENDNHSGGGKGKVANGNLSLPFL